MRFSVPSSWDCGHCVLATARRFGRIAALHVDGVGWNAAGGLESVDGRDDIRDAWHCRIEQLHGKSDGYREWQRNEGVVSDYQSASFEYYDGVAAPWDCRECLLAGARRFGRIAAVLVDGVGWIAAHRIESVGGWDDIGHARHRGIE